MNIEHIVKDFHLAATVKSKQTNYNSFFPQVCLTSVRINRNNFSTRVVDTNVMKLNENV